jgi:hypothetical protein
MAIARLILAESGQGPVGPGRAEQREPAWPEPAAAGAPAALRLVTDTSIDGILFHALSFFHL